VLKIELNNIANKTGLISEIRGYGTHLGFDCRNEEVTNSLQRWLFKSGVHVLKCGPNTLGLRPSLVLGVQDAAKFRDIMNLYSPNHDWQPTAFTD